MILIEYFTSEKRGYDAGGGYGLLLGVTVSMNSDIRCTREIPKMDMYCRVSEWWRISMEYLTFFPAGEASLGSMQASRAQSASREKSMIRPLHSRRYATVYLFK